MTIIKDVTLFAKTILGFEFDIKNWGIGGYVAFDKRPDYVFFLGIVVGPFVFYLGV